MKYDMLREKALANFELLLDHWGIEWKQVNENEYDFLNPTRRDINFGACRFNIEKGRGADFAGRGFSSQDFSSLGIGFSPDDFSGIDSESGESAKIGFDIIGLTQRLHKGNSYKNAASLLKDTLSELSSFDNYINPSRNSAELRRQKQEKKNTQLINYAHKIWGACRDITLENSPAQQYFKSRGLNNVKERSIRFHPAIKNSELKQALPAILFKVQISPEADLSAIHRIYLSQNGKKANVATPKMALARIVGSGIWFGEPGAQLAIAEGPENALTARYCYGFNFVCCSISAGNFGSLTIPKYVRELVLLPDEDSAGINAYKKAVKEYKSQGVANIKRAMLDWGSLEELVSG
jgi:hypothetical protein